MSEQTWYQIALGVAILLGGMYIVWNASARKTLGYLGAHDTFVSAIRRLGEGHVSVFVRESVVFQSSDDCRIDYAVDARFLGPKGEILSYPQRGGSLYTPLRQGEREDAEHSANAAGERYATELSSALRGLAVSVSFTPHGETYRVTAAA